MSICALESGSVIGSERSVVGTLWSRVAKVRSSRRTLRPAVARALEGLRRRDFVNQVEIDIEQCRFAGRFVDDVGIPDFLEECLRGHDCEPASGENANSNRISRPRVASSKAGQNGEGARKQSPHVRGDQLLDAARRRGAFGMGEAAGDGLIAEAFRDRVERAIEPRATCAARPRANRTRPSCAASARSRLCTWMPASRTFSRFGDSREQRDRELGDGRAVVGRYRRSRRCE